MAAAKGAAARGSRAAAVATKSRVAGIRKPRQRKQKEGGLAGSISSSSMEEVPAGQLEEFELELEDLFAAVGQDADPIPDSSASQ
jgi:hypothetical protein